jgi:hypothetical protein
VVEVTIGDDPIPQVNVAVVEAAQIVGTVMLADDATHAGLRQTVVEATSDSERYRTVTDAAGRFSFSALRPGLWTVRVAAAALPVHHRLDREAEVVALAPGEASTVDFEGRPVQRPVRVVRVGALTLGQP